MQTIDINALVRQILSDLMPQSTPKADRCTLAEPAEKIPRISNRVVSLAELERLGDVKRLIVPEKAVMTPAVRDEIHKRNIEIVTEKESASGKAEKPNVWLALHSQRKEPTAILGFLAKNFELEKAAFDCVLRVMDAATEKLAAAQTLGVVVSNYPATAMCVANRKANIRAVLGTDPALLKTDADQIGANLLVVDPVRSGPYRTQSLLKAFLADGVRKVPGFLLSIDCG